MNNEDVKKAVVLAAGEGSRLKPITNAIPKEMIRVGRRPTIEHVLRVLRAGGLKEVLVIIGRKKQAIVDYLGSGNRFGLDIYYRVQEKAQGTGPAISLAEGFIGKDKYFAVMYGDNYLSPYTVMKDILKFHKQKNGNGTIVIHKVKDPRRYGIVKLDNQNKIQGIIEKPTLKEAKPYQRNGYWLNIAGLMILKNQIFPYIKKLKPGKNEEKWLTDAIEKMRKREDYIYGYIFKGKRYDIGTFQSLKKADQLALQDKSKDGKYSEVHI